MEAPLTPNDIVHILAALQGALNQNTNVQKQAESYLASLEQRPGFCSCLAEIVGNKEHDHSARWLASVHFKNSISRTWKGRADVRGLSNEERAHLRTKFSQLLNQDDNQIAVQVALVYAKIARLDFPREWPSLFQDLLSNLSSPSVPTLTVRRVYLVLHHVLKELSSKRLPADQRNFAEVAELLFSHVWGQWCTDTQLLLDAVAPALAAAQAHAAAPAPQQLLLCFERWMLLLKVLRRLILFGSPSDAKSLQPVPTVSMCVPPMVQALQQLVGLRTQAVPVRGAGAVTAPRAPQRSQLLAMLDRGILKLAKTQCQIQETHPWSYFSAQGVLLTMLGFCCDQVVAHKDCGSGAAAASTPFDRYLIQAMTFVINVATCGPYKGKTSGGTLASESTHEQDAPVRQLSSEVGALLNGFWTHDRLASLVSAVIGGYYLLTQRDLEEWDANSEEFYHAGDTTGWQEHVSLCAGNLYLTLLSAHREVLAPVVVCALTSTSAACPASIDPGALPGARVAGLPGPGVPLLLLHKEAAYHAVAVGAYELHDYVDFTPWLRSTLLPELSVVSPTTRPLRRRAARLIADWVARLEEQDRPAVYRALLALLAEDDMCMKMTAVSALSTLVDDWNFSDTQFVDCVGPAMTLLVALLGSASELDSQTQTFHLINLIIERMGDHIRPFAEPLLALVPGLWAGAEGQSLVRIQILLALQRLLNALGSASLPSHGLVLPLLAYAMDAGQPEAVHLLEDALGLWLVALRNTPGPNLAPAQPAGGLTAASAQAQLLASAPVLTLTPLLAKAMTLSTEQIAVGCACLVSAAQLGGGLLAAAYGAELCTIFSSLLGNVSERGMLLLLPCLELVLAAAPGVAPDVLQPALLKLLGLILSGKESALTVATSLGVWSRLLLHAPHALSSLLTTAASGNMAAPHAASPVNAGLAPPEALLGGLLEVWGEASDTIAQPRARKLAALGLCAALGLPSRAPIAHLDTIMASITGVWYELEGGGAGEDGVGGDGGGMDGGLAYLGDDSGLEVDLTAATISEDAEGEVSRRKVASERDPVAQLAVRAALRAALDAAGAHHGAAFNEALNRLDPTIAAQLKAALGM